MDIVSEMIKLKKWWSNFWMDPATRYLSAASDHVDLEMRMKELKRKGIWL
jgi:hypothetical protein